MIIIINGLKYEKLGIVSEISERLFTSLCGLVYAGWPKILEDSLKMLEDAGRCWSITVIGVGVIGERSCTCSAL